MPILTKIPANRTTYTTFGPKSVNGCVLWLDGMDPAGTGTPPSSGATVSTWTDKSTSAKNATSGGTPTYVSGGGVNFDGASFFYNLSFAQNLSQRSIFIVMQETVRNNTNGVFPLIPDPSSGIDWQTTNGMSIETTNGLRFYGSVGYVSDIGNATLLVKAIYNDNMNTQTGSGYLNGTNATNVTAAGTAGTCSGYGVGARWLGSTSMSYGLNGIIYEILFFNTPLGTTDRQSIEGYLAQKWGLTANLPAGHPGLTSNYLVSSVTTPDVITFIRTTGPLHTGFISPIYPAVVSAGTGGSFLFNATPTQYLSIPNSTSFTQNTAFTYELWYYPTSTNSGYIVAMLQHNWITVKWMGAGKIGLDMSYVGNAPGYTPQNRTYAINRWHHIALSWNGTNGVLYMNGVSECTFTGAGATVGDGNPLYIGQYQGQGQPTPQGYFTNFRFVKGVSVYTGAFTPPTAPLTITQSAGTNISAITAGQTQVLLSVLNTNSLVTDSTGNFTVTNNGSVSWNALTPF